MSDDFQPSFNDLMREDIAEPRSGRLERLARPGEEEPPDDGESETYARARPQPQERELVVDDEGVKSMAVWNLDDLKED